MEITSSIEELLDLARLVPDLGRLLRETPGLIVMACGALAEAVTVARVASTSCSIATYSPSAS